MANFGTIFAFAGRQAGKVLNIALGWVTVALFGGMPKERRARRAAAPRARYAAARARGRTGR